MKISTGNLKILTSNLIANAVLKYDVVMYRGKIKFKNKKENFKKYKIVQKFISISEAR